MAQDNVVKQPFQMSTPQNTAGNESGETTMIPGTGESAPFQNPSGVINADYSSENRSAKFKNPSVTQDIPGGAGNQYQ